MDAVADIVGVCLAIYKLAPEQIIASPVHVGYGQIHCAHGILPIPAPATAHILQGIPIYGGRIEGELCTPTGAALLKTFCPVFRTDANDGSRTDRLWYGNERLYRCKTAFVRLSETP